MKFIINKTIQYTQEDRVEILSREEDYFKNGVERTVKYLCNAVICVTKDWNPDDDFSLVQDTDSIQYRPKGIFKNSKGFYYKNKGTQYLTDLEKEEMFNFILAAKKYLENENN